MSVSLKELAAILNTLRQFLKQNDKAVEFPALYRLPKPKQEIGFTLFKDELFAHYFQDIKEQCNTQIRLSFRFERNKKVVFPSKSFKLWASKTFYQRLSIYDTPKCIGFRRIVTILLQSVEFLIAIMTSDWKILSQVLYQDQGIVQLIGDVICPNKKSRGEKCVYLTSSKEINKTTYECKQFKPCSHVLNIPFKDQKPCVPLFGWTYCVRKKTKLDYQKEKLSPLMRQYIHQSKPSTTKAEEAKNEPVPKKVKILPYVE